MSLLEAGQCHDGHDVITQLRMFGLPACFSVAIVRHPRSNILKEDGAQYLMDMPSWEFGIFRPFSTYPPGPIPQGSQSCQFPRANPRIFGEAARVACVAGAMGCSIGHGSFEEVYEAGHVVYPELSLLDHPHPTWKSRFVLLMCLDGMATHATHSCAGYSAWTPSRGKGKGWFLSNSQLGFRKI